MSKRALTQATATVAQAAGRLRGSSVALTAGALVASALAGVVVYELPISAWWLAGIALGAAVTVAIALSAAHARSHPDAETIGSSIASRLPLSARSITLCSVVVSAGFGVLAARTSWALQPVLWAIPLTVMLATPLVIALRRRKFDLFEPIWPVLLFLWLQFPGQALYLGLVSDYGFGLLPLDRWANLLTQALVSCMFGTAAFLVGYYRMPGRVRSLVGRAPRWPGQVDRARLKIAIAVLTGIAIAGYAIFMGSPAGFVDFVENLKSHNVAFRGKYHLYFAIQLSIVASLLWLAVGVRSRKQFAMLAAHAALTFVLIASLGGRGLALSVIEMAFVIYNYRIRRLRPAYVAAFGLVAVVFLVLAGTYRSYTGEVQSGKQQALQTGRAYQQPDLSKRLVASLAPRHFADELFQYDYSSLDIYVLLIDRMPGELSLAWGSTFVDLPLRFVPRSVWQDKPYPFSTKINQQLFGAERSGKKASLIGEAFYNFHFPGIILVMWLYGVLAQALYTYLRSGTRTIGVVLIYAIVYKWIWSLNGGGFSEVTVYSAALLIPAVAALWFVGCAGPAAKATEASSTESSP
ncbi:MAG: oligosaccharide repeat unit polymerase [Actinobacteria bacterium]|nr:oligosaccharide repeat unit polymerase [Actinomycetota bacterium]